MNRGLDLMETFLAFRPSEAATWYSKYTEGAVPATTRAALDELAELLVTNYSTETGIDRDTILFDVPGE